ncbi:kinase-like protein [Rickenella mellea]|uniref:Kinase-like protein n=1 Tax=Rickenella mellea TaxID=50990 RepID=A0A4Y7Q9Z1_9AGAM|nr:kinase-like protein [Rickenella mellea]
MAACVCNSGFVISQHLGVQCVYRASPYDTLDGSVKLGEVMGDDGLAIIRRGHITQINIMGQPVASGVIVLKTLQTSRKISQEKLDKRFRNECSIWSRLCHINIIPLLGVWTQPAAKPGDPPKLPSFVAPFYKFGTLYTFIDANRSKSLASVPFRYQMVTGIYNGIAHLHSRRIVHADLQPSNIMIDDHGRPRISDFGFAKIYDEFGFTSSAPISKTRYAPPEAGTDAEKGLAQAESIGGLCSGGKGSKRGDVWSFGMVALLVIGGYEPFWRTPQIELVRQYVKGGKIPAKDHYEPITDEVWTMLRSCWVWKGSRRSQITEIDITCISNPNPRL